MLHFVASETRRIPSFPNGSGGSMQHGCNMRWLKSDPSSAKNMAGNAPKFGEVPGQSMPRAHGENAASCRRLPTIRLTGVLNGPRLKAHPAYLVNQPNR
jgi:hypothetical protein